MAHAPYEMPSQDQKQQYQKIWYNFFWFVVCDACETQPSRTHQQSRQTENCKICTTSVAQRFEFMLKANSKHWNAVEMLQLFIDATKKCTFVCASALHTQSVLFSKQHKAKSDDFQRKGLLCCYWNGMRCIGCIEKRIEMQWERQRSTCRRVAFEMCLHRLANILRFALVPLENPTNSNPYWSECFTWKFDIFIHSKPIDSWLWLILCSMIIINPIKNILTRNFLVFHPKKERFVNK